MSQVRTRRARIAAATSAAVVAGGVALGLLAGGGGGSTSVADGTVLSNVLAPVVPLTSALLDGSGLADGHTSGTRMG